MFALPVFISGQLTPTSTSGWSNMGWQGSTISWSSISPPSTSVRPYVAHMYLQCAVTCDMHTFSTFESVTLLLSSSYFVRAQILKYVVHFVRVVSLHSQIHAYTCMNILCYSTCLCFIAKVGTYPICNDHL